MNRKTEEELQWLEEQLLASELTEEELDTLCDEIIDEVRAEDEAFFGDFDEDTYGEFAPEDQPRRYRTGTEEAYGGILEDAEPPKEKSVRGLVLCASLECLAIAAVMLWWVFRIL